jgi:membrane protease YdiL (CAAX protease family)
MTLVKRAIATVRKDFAGDDTTPPLDARTTTVFVVSTVLLTVFYYYGKTDAYRRYLSHRIEPRIDGALTAWIDLFPYAWWGTTSIVLRVVVPAAIIVWAFRERLGDWGFRLRGQLAHAPIYVALYVGMLPFLYWASLQPAFLERYPFYGPAADGGVRFWAWAFVYALQFVGVEAFFRGFMTFGLHRRFGFYGILIMTIPYVMIHFNKPVAETLGALVAGIVLGVLAIRSRSFVGGILLHVAIAITMDLFAIAGHHGGIGGALRAIF